MIQRTQRFLTAVLAAAIMLLVACSSVPTGKVVAEQPPIKIGVIVPLTGEAAAYGIAAKEGMDLAVEEINRNGGVLGKKLELVYQDSKFDPKEAVSIMQKFVAVDDFDLIVMADGSGPTLAAAPVAQQNGRIFLATLASTPMLSATGDFFFRTVPSDAYQGVELAKFAQSKGFKTAAILYVNDPYGVGIRDVFTREFDGTVLIAEAFENGDTDFRTQLTKIKAKNPEVLLLVVRKELPNVLIQRQTLEIKGVMIGSETTKDQSLIDSSQGAAEGMFTVYFTEPDDFRGYREHFQQKYGREPGMFSDYSYDGIYVLADAVAKAGSTNPDAVRGQLREAKYYGATGIVQFDANGDVVGKPFTVFQVQQGRFVEVTV